jgi:NADPH2:quinone reductase
VLATCGHLVNFGQSSGPAAPITLADLSAKSATVSRPIVFHYMRERAARQTLSDAVFGAVAAGFLHVDAPRVYALHEAAAAHRDLEARVAMGPPVLVP